ncbi:Protein N-acetyltransferase, RimJ/RimL family [Agromyces sp. CF514]|uniref:GNAT family N-acetyltransferase n=1 Tax=Agromyces sp. CF514 TaxID=1881031 RepID=UPI0008F02115|nr:GNAT family N-acetyltransferase [Agromyces sp. CF514]SFR83245.1 Protein N-acetyltransferase, RimJ/RimL family [Agromyces sp. CF514]
MTRLTKPYGPLPFSLETERLRLQLWEESDAAGYRALVGERGDEPPTLDEARAEIRDARERAPERGIHLLTLRVRGTDEFLGYCGLVVGRTNLDEPEIAYELLRSAHGHGYATEAADAVVTAARATGRARLRSTTRPSNTASQRVLDKLGFRHDRTTADEHGDILWYVLDL